MAQLGPNGSYLNIGANHPYKSSNTYLLYQAGWSGLTIEPIKSLCEQHRRIRPRDICLNAAAGASSGIGTFHELNPSGFSTFDSAVAEQLCGSHRAVASASYDVSIVTATEAWMEHRPGRSIDFLSIDAEGHEESVLSGIDFELLRPRLVMLEFEAATGTPRTERLLGIVAANGYGLVDTFGVNGLFSHRRT